MKLKIEGNRLVIEGNIKSLKDLEDIKSALDSMKKEHNSIKIDIVDSISITSSVIGYINKLIHADNVNISIEVGTQQLYEILDELNLIDEFKVKRK